MRRLSLLLLCLAPALLEAQTATARRRIRVEDSPCAPSTAWRVRDTNYTSSYRADIAARTPIQCPVGPPIVTPPPVVVPPVVTAPAALGVWSNVTPANVNLATDPGCGNYGVENVQFNPTEPGAAYAFFHCQGLWKSVDYGAAWQGPISPSSVNNCAGGIRIGQDGAIHLACYRGAVGYWKSLDRGLTFSRYAIAPAASNRQDVYPPSVDPSDPQHLLMAGHEQDVLVESVNGGVTWTSVPVAPAMRVSAGTASISFINTGTASTRGTFLWIAQQSDAHGTWRTTNGGASWTKVDNNEHPHGFAEVYQPDASGVVYMAGAYSALGWGVLRSTDYGATWRHVTGATGNQRAVIGTGSRLFASLSYPSGLNTTFGPDMQTAAQPGTGAWTPLATPAAMRQGASQFAVTSDGTRSYVLSANYGAGLWRYVEGGGTVPPVVQPPIVQPPVVIPPAVVPPPVVTPPPAGGTNGVPFDPGVSTAYIRSNPTLPNVINYEGNFRTVCFAGKVGTFDPIVYPGQTVAGHEHLFLGNLGIDGFSTSELLRTSGNSNCFGGTANRTGYWMPTIRDSLTGQLQIPERAHIYYKSAYMDARILQVIPAGLKMIAGDKNNTTGRQEHAEWYCSRTYIPNTDGVIPNCPVGEQVMVSIAFPECWNGRDLDSPDHQSHMAYNLHRNPGPSICPASHPVPLPRIEEIFIFPVNAGAQPSRWRLSSDMYSTAIRGGRSVHADWMNGWDQAVLTTLTRSCINATRDCTVDLGDGRQLWYPR